MEGIVLIDDVENNRDQWHKLRDVSIGASEAITACGINPYKSLLAYWAEKTGRKPRDDENEFMRLGRHMEPFIGGLFGRKTGYHIKPANSILRHKDLEWAVASPDFFVFNSPISHEPLGCLETKNVSHFAAINWENDEVPNYALMQNIWQQAVCGFEMSWVGALCGGNPENFYHPEVHYDEEVFEQMVELVDKFREMVKTDTPPKAKSVDIKLLDAMQKARRESEEATVELVSDEAQELTQEYINLSSKLTSANSNVKQLKELRDGARARLTQLMDGATQGICAGNTLILKRKITPPYPHPGSDYWDFVIKTPKKN